MKALGKLVESCSKKLMSRKVARPIGQGLLRSKQKVVRVGDKREQVLDV
jgi:hypothetical protein